MFCTYLHINETGVFYVGCGSKRRPYLSGRASSQWKLASLGGYSVWIVGEFKTKKEAWEHEKELIAYFNPPCNKSLGGSPGGSLIYGGQHTWESKLKMSLSSGRLTPDQIRAIRIDPRRHHEIGLDYGISRNHVTNIKQGRRGTYA